MNEDQARTVTLLQAFETAQPPSPSWTDDDSAWATRLALQDNAATPTALTSGSQTPASSAGAETFIPARAAHAMHRLAPREPAASAWLARRLWRWRWLVWVVIVASVFGIAADSIGSTQRINLLAPPLWAVLVWNAVVYLVLAGHALARLMRRDSKPGALTTVAQRLLRTGRALPGLDTSSRRSSAGGSAAALQMFATLWMRRSAPLSSARAATVLHAAAAALALGLIAGLYLRGLVFDYRAAWESTFLSADAAHAIIATALAPAALLSSISVPDVAAFESMRSVHGGTAGASAAPWIHLFVLTLMLFVVLPRTLLAVSSALRSSWLSRRFAMPLSDPYFQRLVRQRQGGTANVVVTPYANTPTPQAALRLRALVTTAFGDGLDLTIAPTIAFDAEDEATDLDLAGPASGRIAVPGGTTLAIGLFELSATPENESHGRFLRALAGQATTVMLVDERSFIERFGAASARVAQRREAWSRFAETLQSVPVFADLGAVASAASGAALDRAMRRPVRVVEAVNGRPE